jgi:hypothetical protein
MLLQTAQRILLRSARRSLPGRDHSSGFRYTFQVESEGPRYSSIILVRGGLRFAALALRRADRSYLADNLRLQALAVPSVM